MRSGEGPSGSSPLELPEGGGAAHGGTPWDAAGAGGTGPGVPVCPPASCPPGSSRPGQDDGGIWKSLEVVLASHLSMRHPCSTQLWGAWPWGTQPRDTQRGVPGRGAAQWGTSPPAPSLAP